LEKEKSVGTFLSAISTLTEDAPEIMLLVYIMGRGGVQHENIREFNRCTGFSDVLMKV